MSIESLVQRAISEGLFPGCAISVFGNGETYQKCFGMVGPTHIRQSMPVSVDTLYDEASLTKVKVSLAILVLIGQGKLTLQTRIGKFLLFADEAIINASIWHLMTCQLDYVFSDELQKYGLHLRDGQGNFRVLNETKINGKVGEMFRYGNPSWLFLGWIIEKITKKNLEEALIELVLQPLEMEDTKFGATQPGRLDRVAPTQVIGRPFGVVQYGTVHDPMSLSFVTPVGIAGLFSSIVDMAKFCRFFATGRTPDGGKLVPHWLYKTMTLDQLVGTGHRWSMISDMPSEGYVSNTGFCEMGNFMAGSSGCFFFGWRQRKFAGVILSNSNPKEKAKLKQFRREFVEDALSVFGI